MSLVFSVISTVIISEAIISIVVVSCVRPGANPKVEHMKGDRSFSQTLPLLRRNTLAY